MTSVNTSLKTYNAQIAYDTERHKNYQGIIEGIIARNEDDAKEIAEIHLRKTLQSACKVRSISIKEITPKS